MSSSLILSLQLDQPATYRIQVQGRLNASWANWFGTDTIQVTQGESQPPVTTMTGRVADQAALFGWLSRLRNLGLPLLLVEYLPPEDNDGEEQPEGETIGFC